MRHDDRVRDEFSRQAATFSASPAITDAALTQRFIDALGEAAQGSVLDVVCGPGILSAAIAKTAREMVAFDLTPWRIISIGRAGRCPRYSAFSGPAAGLSSLMSFHRKSPQSRTCRMRSKSCAIPLTCGCCLAPNWRHWSGAQALRSYL